MRSRPYADELQPDVPMAMFHVGMSVKKEGPVDYAPKDKPE